MNSLVVHIGVHKTGSGSIQHALNVDHEALLEQGVYVPRTATSNYKKSHRNLAWELNRHPRFREGRGTMKELHEELASIKAPVAVISAEGFSKLTKQDLKTQAKYKRLQELAQSLSRKLIVVGFVREYASVLNAAYTQQIKTFGNALTFDKFLGQALTWDRWQYGSLFEGFEAVADRVVVIQYGGDSVPTFYQALDIKPPREKYDRVNSGYGPHGIEACRILYRHYRATFQEGTGRMRKGGPAGIVRSVAEQLNWNETNFWGFDPNIAADVHQTLADRDARFISRHGIQFKADFNAKRRNELLFENMNEEQRREFIDGMGRIVHALGLPLETWLRALEEGGPAAPTSKLGLASTSNMS